MSYLPPSISSTSFWLTSPSRLQKHRSTANLPQDADLVIVGSGITAALTTYHLLKRRPGLKILILEARDFCSGATGRNGGQIKVDPYIAYPALAERLGHEQANDLLSFEAKHLDLFAQLLKDEAISCDFHITSAYDVCLTEEMATIGREAFAMRREQFPKDMEAYLEMRTPEEAERLSQAKGALWGCIYRVGSVHPYKLVNGIMERCFALAAQGEGWVNLQTWTPAKAITHCPASPRSWTVRTDREQVSAPKILLATNAYTSALLPELEDKVIPVKGTAASFEVPPLQSGTTPSLEVMRPFFTTYSLKYAPGIFDYMISRQAGKRHVVLGGAHQAFQHDPETWYSQVDDNTLLPGTERYYKALMPRMFVNYPENESRVDRIWTGILGYSSDSCPWVGPVPERPAGIFTCAGFTGRGMVRIFGSVVAMTDLLLSDITEEEAQRDALLNSGLPRSFVITRERLASKENIVVAGIRQQSHENTALKSRNIPKARL